MRYLARQVEVRRARLQSLKLTKQASKIQSMKAELASSLENLRKIVQDVVPSSEANLMAPLNSPVAGQLAAIREALKELHCAMQVTKQLSGLQELQKYLDEIEQDPRGVQAAFAALALTSTVRVKNPKLIMLLGYVLSRHMTPAMMKGFGDFQTVLCCEHSRHYGLSDSDFGTRGGRKYYKPVGWKRFALNVRNYNGCKDWCVAYHGTKHKHALPILLSGLQPPGTKGVKVEHGQAGAPGGSPTIYWPAS
eukprot:2160848-Amphidinium_carterae.1